MAFCVLMYALAIAWCLLGWGCNTVSGIGQDLQAVSAGTSRRFEKHAETMWE
jgi:predicted small secreted protein